MNKVKLLAVAFAVSALFFSGAQAGKVNKKVACNYSRDGDFLAEPKPLNKENCKKAEKKYKVNIVKLIEELIKTNPISLGELELLVSSRRS